MACLRSIRLKLGQKFRSFEPSDKVRDIPSVVWVRQRRGNRKNCWAMAKGKGPTASLYRMYEYLVVGWDKGLKLEARHFFRQHTWDMKSIPDPKDTDPVRYAIIAALIKYLVRAFNFAIERDVPRDASSIGLVLEQAPEWTRLVPRLKDSFVLRDNVGKVPEERLWCPEFLKKNIVLEESYAYFLF